MEKILKITGKGKISVPPDRTRMRMVISKIDEDYSAVMTYGAEAATKMSEIVKRSDFDPNELKTISWNVEPSFEYYIDEKTNENKRRLVGYKYTHGYCIEFDIDNEVLSRLLTNVIDSDLEPEIFINYIVSDPEKYKDELIIKSIQDSKHKAEVIAQAGNVELGNIVTIDYSWTQLKADSMERPITVPEFSKPRGTYKASDITPADIDIADTITVVWAIK